MSFSLSIIGVTGNLSKYNGIVLIESVIKLRLQLLLTVRYGSASKHQAGEVVSITDLGSFLFEERKCLDKQK